MTKKGNSCLSSKPIPHASSFITADNSSIFPDTQIDNHETIFQSSLSNIQAPIKFCVLCFYNLLNLSLYFYSITHHFASMAYFSLLFSAFPCTQLPECNLLNIHQLYFLLTQLNDYCFLVLTPCSSHSLYIQLKSIDRSFVSIVLSCLSSYYGLPFHSACFVVVSSLHFLHVVFESCFFQCANYSFLSFKFLLICHLCWFCIPSFSPNVLLSVFHWKNTYFSISEVAICVILSLQDLRLMLDTINLCLSLSCISSV